MPSRRPTRKANTLIVFVLLVATMTCGCVVRQALSYLTPDDALGDLVVCCANCAPLQSDSDSEEPEEERSSSSCCIKGTGLDLSTGLVAVFIPISLPPTPFELHVEFETPHTRAIDILEHGPPETLGHGRALVEHGSILRV